MRRIKPTFYLLTLFGVLLGAMPSARAAPEQFKLGAEAPAPKALQAPAGAKPSATKGKAGTAKPAKATGKATKRVGKVAAKSKARKTADVIANDVPPAKIDLTLPKDMVEKLQPPGKPAGTVPASAARPDDGAPLLPSLFAPKEGAEPFQLNGRLLTNEMDLQLRNESRRDVEGAALDFKFKQ